jgi:hypothetical protein
MKMQSDVIRSKKVQLLELFIQWKSESPDYLEQFITDGIVDEEEYNSAIPKVLFIAKEPNDQTKDSWDYFELLLDYDNFKYPFLYRLAEWAYGILNDFPEFEQLWADDKNLHKVFRNIAFMNVKKSGGLGYAFSITIEDHIRNNQKFLINEIEIIDPNIIVTCLSLENAVNLLFPEAIWMMSEYGIRIGKFKQSKIIDFYHPSSRKAKISLYNLLNNIIRSEVFKNL